MKSKRIFFGKNGITMQEVDIFYFHGFLGRPSDWEKVHDFVKSKYVINGNFVDYFSIPSLSPKNSLSSIGSNIITYINNHSFGEKKILVGYSMGARLLMHAMEIDQRVGNQYILVSGNHGLEDKGQIQDRLSKDFQWADSFLNLDWDEVLKLWNKQSVFDGSIEEPIREESEFRRDLLAKAMTNWSLAKQKDKTPILEKLVNKIVWVCGQRDRKFIELSKKLSNTLQELDIRRVSDSGHRVLFDNPNSLGTIISETIKKALFV